MIRIERYTSDLSTIWDSFVEGSKNGTFLFQRGYMDYHSDRFHDHSLMYYDQKDRLLALLPANETGNILFSHQGLTYGGLILSANVRTVQVMDIFYHTIMYLREKGIQEWNYKQIPTCYHRCPCQEDTYALWRAGAQLESCLVSTTIPLNGCSLNPEVERRRNRGFRKAQEAGYQIVGSTDLSLFWPIMENNLLDRYSVKPVHTIDEMSLLMSRFPENIKLFLAVKDSEPQAGCIVYIANDTCVHIQYGHATPQGKEEGALDLLYLSLIHRYQQEGYQYLDFGNSNEDRGHILNENLIAQKEGFGGRAIVYNQYKITI